MKFISGGTRIFLVLAVGALFGCSRSVKVDKLRQDPTVPTGTGTTALPGFPSAPFVAPTTLSNAECMEEAAPKIIIYGGAPGTTSTPPPGINRFPTSGNSFVTFWTVCNASKVAQPAGVAYSLDILNQTINASLPLTDPNHALKTLFTSQGLAFPALASCACFVQEVGINMDVPLSAAQQASITGQLVSFPKITVPIEAAPTGNLSFDYVASLPAQYGVTVLEFKVN